MKRVTLGAVLRECKRRGIRFGNDKTEILAFAKRAKDLYDIASKVNESDIIKRMGNYSSKYPECREAWNELVKASTGISTAMMYFYDAYETFNKIAKTK